MSQREIPPLHEVAKLEYKLKFMLFLCNIGIKSAFEVADELWIKYTLMMAELSVGG